MYYGLWTMDVCRYVCMYMLRAPHEALHLLISTDAAHQSGGHQRLTILNQTSACTTSLSPGDDVCTVSVLDDACLRPTAAAVMR
jgi:hypothetical protein